MIPAPQPSPQDDGRLSLTGPDSSLILSAWAFDEQVTAATPRVIPAPTLSAELDRKTKQLVLRADAESSYQLLAEKVSQFNDQTLRVKPKGIIEGATEIKLTMIKNGQPKELTAQLLKIHVSEGRMVLKSVVALVDGREVEVFNEKRFHDQLPK